FPRQPLPVSAQFVEQLGAEHHVAIFAPLAATDMNHHALGTPPVTHTYIKPSSNQRSTTARVASAAGRLRSSPLRGRAMLSTVASAAVSSNPVFRELGRWSN